MILITGATGLVGRNLVSHLVEAGWPVRVYVQSRRGEWPDGVDVVRGRLADAGALHQAMQRVHPVFHLAGAQWWGSPRELDRIDLQGTRHVITAARSARVGRLVYLSHLGAEPSSAYTLLRVKGQAESLVRNSGLAYTILRCGVIFGPDDTFVNGIAMLLRANPFIGFQPGHGESLLHPRYVGDLVKALANSLENIDLVDATIEIGGAEYISYNEMLRTVMRVSGARRLIISLPPWLLRRLTAVMMRLFRRWPITPQWYDVLASNRTAKLGNLYDYTGVRPVRFEDTLLTYMPRRHYGWDLLRFILTRHS